MENLLDWRKIVEQFLDESTPQPGKSSGKAKEFKPESKPIVKYLTVDELLKQVEGIPYYNDVVDDLKKGDESWDVTKKVKEYAEYMMKNPSSLKELPPIIVIDMKLNDGAHRISAIYLLEKLLDSKNSFWKNHKLKIYFYKEEDVLTPQPVNEGDPKVGTGKKPKGSGRRLYTDENPNDTVKVKFSTKQDIIDTLNKASFKSKPHARQSQIINLIHQRVRAALNRTKDPQKKAKLRSAFEYIKKRKEASKKKTERLKKQKTNEAIDTNFDKVKFYHDYYTNVSPSTFEVTLEENDIRISNIVEPDPSLPPPEDIRQIPVNQDLEENIDPEVQSKHKGKAAPFGSAYEPVKEKKGFDKNLGKDPFGLNMFAYELMREEESYDTFDYPKHIKSLTKFMLDKGMELRPLPTVKFINDDIENAKDFFGKTAYYDPNHHRIVLYTLNRHPKDVMRSFAHEMIHHMQNHEGKLKTIHTQNTNEEGDLPEIEREAYEKGNMRFREWTDTITNGVLKETIVGDKIQCDNCGWSWKIEDGGDDLYMCHKCDHDNTPQSNQVNDKF